MGIFCRQVKQMSEALTMNSQHQHPQVLLTPSKKRVKKGQKHQNKRMLQKLHRKKNTKSSSGEIRLRGVFQKPSPGSQKQMIYMPNKLSLTKVLVDKYNILKSDNFKFHHESAELLLDDYKSYMLNFLKQRNNRLHNIF